MIRKVGTEYVIGSKDLAKKLGVEHKHLLASIRKAIANGDTAVEDNTDASYKDLHRRVVFQFNITEAGLDHFLPRHQPALVEVRKLFAQAREVKEVPLQPEKVHIPSTPQRSFLAPPIWVSSQRLLEAYPLLFGHAQAIVQTWPRGCKQSAVLTMALRQAGVKSRKVQGLKFKVTEFYMPSVWTWIERLPSKVSLDI